MLVSELKKTGNIYKKFISDWLFYGQAFEAGKPFIRTCLFQHPAESDDNFKIRLKEAFNFPYCQNIVTIYNYFLTEKPAIRKIDNDISDRVDWQDFMQNCDFYGTNFDSFLNESQKLAGAYGTAGILVDYPPGKHNKEDNSRPYLSLYTPPNILDWEFERDFETGRPKLTYLKLKEGERTYLIWTLEKWEKYRIKKTYDGEEGFIIEAKSTGPNRLGEVPFVFLPNIKSHKYPYLGISDIVDASLVSGSIIRTLSMGSEVMKLAGFPMLLLPMESESQFLEESTGSDGNEDLVVSERSVLEFDPDAKNGRPAWLESPVEPSINAILSWMDRLTEEMYRAANLSGLHQMRDKAQTKSSTYMRYEFQQTNSVLSKKAESLVEAEKQIYYFWGKWKEIDEMDKKTTISRIKEFSIDALQTEIENMITALNNVTSDHFNIKMQKRLAKHTYPDLSDQDLDIMGVEIQKNLKQEKTIAEN